MSDELNPESRAALVKYRIERANETMLEANLLFQQGFYNAAVNRLYYACYYATIALLLKYKISAQTHNGVKAMFGLHFVSTGIVDIAIGQTLSTLFEKRQSGDYEDFVYCDKEMVEELTSRAHAFIQCLSDLLDKDV